MTNKKEAFGPEWAPVEAELDAYEYARRKEDLREIQRLQEIARTINPPLSVVLFVDTGDYRIADDPGVDDIKVWDEYNKEQKINDGSLAVTVVPGVAFSFKAEPDRNYIRLDHGSNVIYNGALPIVDRLFSEGYTVLDPAYQVFQTDTPREIAVQIPQRS